MSHCQKCNKEILKVENDLYNGYCENCYEELQEKNSKVINSTYKSNLVAKIFKYISIIIIIISIIGIIVYYINEEITETMNITSIIIAILSSILIFGFGEIIQLLEDIKNKK